MKKLLFLGIILSLIVVSPVLALEDDDAFLGFSHSEKCTPNKGYKLKRVFDFQALVKGAKYIKKIGDIDLCKKGLLPSQVLQSFKPGQTIQVTYTDKKGASLERTVKLQSLKNYKENIAGITKIFTPLSMLKFLYESRPDKYMLILVYFKHPTKPNKGQFLFGVKKVDDNNGIYHSYGSINKKHPLFATYYGLSLYTTFFNYEDGKKMLKTIEQKFHKFKDRGLFAGADYSKVEFKTIEELIEEKKGIIESHY